MCVRACECVCECGCVCVCVCVSVGVKLVTSNDEPLRTVRQLSCYSVRLSSFSVIEKLDIVGGTYPKISQK